VTSDAETAPEQARQQVLQGAIAPNLGLRIAVHGSAASNRRASAGGSARTQGPVPRTSISPAYVRPVSFSRKQSRRSPSWLTTPSKHRPDGPSHLVAGPQHALGTVQPTTGQPAACTACGMVFRPTDRHGPARIAGCRHGTSKEVPPPATSAAARVEASVTEVSIRHRTGLVPCAVPVATTRLPCLGRKDRAAHV
jgi:hypothetical protein